jgi:Golgi phosphoprotein 3
MLTLSEKLLLIGLHDDKGSVVFSASTALPYGLAGALLLELFLAKRLDFSGKNVRVVSSQPFNNELLDEVLGLISSSGKVRDAKYWLKTIHAKVKNIQQRLAEQLVTKKVLASEAHSFLWVFNYKRYPTINSKPEQDVRSEIKQIALRGNKADSENAALLGLVKACELVNEVFDKSERSRAKKRIDDLSKDQSISKIVAQVVEEIQVAIILLISAATVTTSVTS